ncbi:hypothetical protein FQ707_04545 [Bacteroidaceae bacterium HV4-6-C5C]|nr:hypothetical protein FQ707_04545 [Bacteroidaceae bacterium HV4-6-C5C]
MLTREMKDAIGLLKEIHYTNGYVVQECLYSETSRMHVRHLLDLLCDSCLLRVVEKSGSDPLAFRYSLTHPLSQITLSSLLYATGGELYFLRDSNVIYETYGVTGRKLAVVNQMVCHLLSQIPITDILFSEDSLKDSDHTIEK